MSKNSFTFQEQNLPVASDVFTSYFFILGMVSCLSDRRWSSFLAMLAVLIREEDFRSVYLRRWLCLLQMKRK